MDTVKNAAAPKASNVSGESGLKPDCGPRPQMPSKEVWETFNSTTRLAYTDMQDEWEACVAAREARKAEMMAKECGEPPALNSGEKWQALSQEKKAGFLTLFDNWRKCVAKYLPKTDSGEGEWEGSNPFSCTKAPPQT